MNERKKWRLFYQITNAVIFIGALSQFNEFMEEKNSNRMVDCLNLLESLSEYNEINHVPFYLILNKQDLFFKEISKDPISIIFQDCPDSLKGKYNQPRIKIPKRSKPKITQITNEISSLSEDELLHIFGFLDYSEVFNLSFVNSLFYQIGNSNPIWKILCEQFDPKIDFKKVSDFVELCQTESSIPWMSCFKNPWKYYFFKSKIVFLNHQNFVIDEFQKRFPQIKKIFISSATSDDMNDVLDKIFSLITMEEK
jgi:hypothetical protein